MVRPAAPQDPTVQPDGKPQLPRAIFAFIRQRQSRKPLILLGLVAIMTIMATVYGMWPKQPDKPTPISFLRHGRFTQLPNQPACDIRIIDQGLDTTGHDPSDLMNFGILVENPCHGIALISDAQVDALDATGSVLQTSSAIFERRVLYPG